MNTPITNKDVSIENKLENLPPKSGVYQFKDKDEKILYIGKAVNLRNRVRQYFQKSRSPDSRIEAMVSKIRDVETIVTDSEVEALILEATLIKKFKPRYNVDLKDDKSYPYIVVTNEPYPRVFVTRRIIRDGSKYFGPFTDVKNMRISLKMIREIFKVRSCNYMIDEDVIKKRKIKVCLDYHIKKCDGPCEGLISQEQYAGMINEVAQVLKGKTHSLVKSLEEKMYRAAEELHFEEAAEIRDRMNQLNVYTERQKIVDTELIDRDLFAIATEGNDACGVIFKVRDGKIIGRQHIYMNGIENLAESDIVEQFLERYYLDAEDVPREVFLTVEVENQATIQQWLSQKRGNPVDLFTPKIGEKAKLMTMCKSNARFLLDDLKTQRLQQGEYLPHSVKALQRDLRLQRPPRRIECFDISNIQGSDSVASMVVFENGKSKKSEYRKFKIKSVEGPDDFASIREVITRRYSRLLEEGGEMPGLVVIDGGKGQLSSACEALENLYRNIEKLEDDKLKLSLRETPIIGLAKRLEEIYFSNVSEPQTLPRTSSGLKLLQQIRNEAHRFAITYHRILRKKRTLQTELDLISGVGKKRAKELLEAFGSVQGVKFATHQQLSDIVGEKVATDIETYFEEAQIG
ncbi:MAG TPA: excinuclease ABC subunit UvrC [Bacteroidota bacterium]|nr:excinuclease ABC subunit UvrC [Bacteroidota bacterium]